MCYHKPFGAIIISPMVRAGMIFFSIIKNQHFYCVVHDKLDGQGNQGGSTKIENIKILDNIPAIEITNISIRQIELNPSNNYQDLNPRSFYLLLKSCQSDSSLVKWLLISMECASPI